MTLPAPLRRPILLGLLALTPATLLAAAPTWNDVGPLFSARCTICHNGTNAPNGLELGSHGTTLKGGKNGPVVIAGKAGDSELVKRIKGEKQPRMPLTGPPFLSDAEIALVVAWVNGGALPGNADQKVPPVPAANRAPGDPVRYSDVEPILLARCVKCHSENGIMGAPPEGFILRTYEQTLAATDRVRVVPGQPLASELVRRIRGLSSPRMPFDGPPWLSEAEMALIEKWIEQGARDRDGKPAPIPLGAAVRFRGTLTGPSEIDGLPFDRAGARVDKAPRVGGTAELRGTVNADGSIQATRLRGR